MKPAETFPTTQICEFLAQIHNQECAVSLWWNEISFSYFFDEWSVILFSLFRVYILCNDEFFGSK